MLLSHLTLQPVCTLWFWNVDFLKFNFLLEYLMFFPPAVCTPNPPIPPCTHMDMHAHTHVDMHTHAHTHTYTHTHTHTHTLAHLLTHLPTHPPTLFAQKYCPPDQVMEWTLLTCSFPARVKTRLVTWKCWLTSRQRGTTCCWKLNRSALHSCVSVLGSSVKLWTKLTERDKLLAPEDQTSHWIPVILTPGECWWKLRILKTDKWSLGPQIWNTSNNFFSKIMKLFPSVSLCCSLCLCTSAYHYHCLAHCMCLCVSVCQCISCCHPLCVHACHAPLLLPPFVYMSLFP